MKQKRYFKTVTCLALGAVLLTGSAFANYEHASGYTNIKNAVLNMMTVENLSGTLKYSVSLNGAKEETQTSEFKYDKNGNASYYIKSTGDDYYSESWTQNGMNISKYSKHYSVANTTSKGFNDYLSNTNDNKEYYVKLINFAELLCDTLVGDMKNNVVLVSTDNDSSTYQLNLGNDQVPELIKSGLDLLISDNGRSFEGGYINTESRFSDEDLNTDNMDNRLNKAWEYLEEQGNTGVVLILKDGSLKYFTTEIEYYDYMGLSYDNATRFFYLSQVDAAVDVVNCRAVLDSEGRLSEAMGSVTFTGRDKDGNSQSLTFEVVFTAYDYGTTFIEEFDLSILSYDWNSHAWGGEIYKKLNFDLNGNLTYEF